MKKLIFLFFTLFSIFTIVSCDDNNDNEPVDRSNPLPEAIQKDVSSRLKSGEVTDFKESDSQAGIINVNFENKDTEETGTIAYLLQDQKWLFTYSEIKSISQLPKEVQTTFDNLIYKNAIIEKISKTERRDLNVSTYDIYFLHDTKMAQNVVHNVLINSDGRYLTTITADVKKPTFYSLYPLTDEISLIKDKYKNSEIKFYYNYTANTNNYIILHNDVIKFVEFRDNKWEKTDYKLPNDTKIPENVLNYLKRTDPNFVYTEVSYREGPEGNCYILTDTKSINDLGYIVTENTK